MTVCNVCGGIDFDLHDGHYFCSECNTKLQNVGQSQEEEDEYCDTGFSQLSIVSSGKKSEQPKKKELGEQWTTHQCFNIIISKQVEKLIELGASSHLKFVVFYLWAKYLKKCEVAFMGSEAKEDWLPRLGTVPYHRDIIILYKGKTKLPWVYYKQEGEDDSEQQTDDENETIEENGIESSNVSWSEVTSENCSDIDEPPAQAKKPKKARKLVFNKEAEEKQSKSAPTVRSRKKRKLKNCNDFMSVEKTAAFCYLGLLLVKDNILLFDLIRWAREGHFPYVSCSSLLPSTMKLQSHDWRYITAYKAPDYEIVNVQAHKLAVFLEVDDLPERPLMPIVARFVIDLNLPNELLPFVHQLIDDKLPSMDWKTSGFPKYELMAMSVIIIALKLLFGLDDDMERRLSTMGRKLRDYLPKELQPFIWEDWMQSIMHKLNFIYHTHAPSAIFSESDLYNVNSFRTFYEETVYNCWHPRDAVLRKGAYATPEFRDTMRKTFSDLSETEGNTLCPLTSFPLTGWTNFYKSETMANDKLYSEDFSCCSLAYLVNWRRFQQDPTLCSIYNCHLDSKNLFSKSDEPLEGYILAHNQYWIHLWTNTNQSEVPYKSFNWLLSTCSRYLEVSTEKLYQEQLNMEKLIFNLQQPKLPPSFKKIPSSWVRSRTKATKSH